MNFLGVHELACHDGTPYPAEWRATRLVRLRAVFNPVRDQWGRPVRAVSGYRTVDWNRRVGGARHSQHVEGKALDAQPIVADDDDLATAVDDYYALILRMLAAGELAELGGLGLYPGKWVHLDVRPRAPGGHVVTWYGAGVGSEVA